MEQRLTKYKLKALSNVMLEQYTQRWFHVAIMITETTQSSTIP